MAYQTLSVRAPGGDYPIYIGAGVIGALPELLTARGLGTQAVIVTNQTLAPLYGEPLADALGATLAILPDGESHKTLDSVRTLYEAFADAGLDRSAVVIALGGGVIGDTAGFAAASYLRGLPFVQVPTSLLAMVDSSVGGKVGVNLPRGKNLVGAFKQPELVAIDTDMLGTLPDGERRAGLAEAIKHGLLADPSLLDPAEYAAPSANFVARAVQVKIDVVGRDPYERGERAHLNLGHTFAHAIESVANYRWRHGDAVAVGLVAAARLSYLHGLCDAELPARVESIIADAGLPTRYADFAPADLRAAMDADKKRQKQRLRFVLLRAVGQPVLCDDVPEDAIRQVWESLRAG